MKALLIGDVGGVGGYHAGDEAMLDVAIGQLRNRGSTAITVVSGDPDDTSTRYDVDAIARAGFAGREMHSDDARDERLAAVLAIADGADDAALLATGGAAAARALVDAVASSDAVIVTGGGNLSSSWPDQLYERVAVLLLAQRFGVPAVVSGQTIGPALSTRHGALLAQALAHASLVGLRERSSYELVAGIVPDTSRRSLQLDDATFLPEEPVGRLVSDALFADGFVALTVNPLGVGPEAEARMDALTELVRAACALTGLKVLFLPHVGAPNGSELSGDGAVASALHERLGEGPEFVVAPFLPARQLAWVTRRSSAIITTRYHAAVFGMTAAVPCLALYQDRYTLVKLRGALDHAGLGAWRIPFDALGSKLATEALGELWSRRGEISSHLRSVTAPWSDWDHAHWDEVWEAVRPNGHEPSGLHQESRRAVPVMAVATLEPKLESWRPATAVADALMARNADLELQLHASVLEAERLQRLLVAALAARDADQDEIRRWQTEARELDLQRAEVEAEKIQLRDETMLAELSADAARSMAAELLRRLAVEDAAHIARLDAIDATKTMRWTARSRELYSRIRRLLRLP